jgi:hypothetical protein
VDIELQRRYGSIGGLRTSARHDVRELTEPARRAFDERFLREVDPEGVLPGHERARRAAAARRAYFATLTARSIVARRTEAAPLVADRGAAVEVTNGSRQPPRAAARRTLVQYGIPVLVAPAGSAGASSAAPRSARC